jgi:hypothetical protein
MSPSSDYKEHNITLWNMIQRHLSPENSVEMIRYVFMKSPAKFISYWLAEQRRVKDSDILTSDWSSMWDTPGNYYLGGNPGMSLDEYISNFKQKAGENSKNLAIVIATCTQGCTEYRGLPSGGHAYQNEIMCNGCSYGTVYDDLAKESKADIIPLTRTSKAVMDVVVPAIKDGHYKASIFYVCPWAIKPVTLTGASVVGRIADFPIVVSLLEGNICNLEQFSDIETSGKVSRDVSTYIPQYGTNLLRNLTGTGNLIYSR